MGDSIYEVSFQGTALKKAFSEGLICVWSEKKKKNRASLYSGRKKYCDNESRGLRFHHVMYNKHQTLDDDDDDDDGG